MRHHLSTTLIALSSLLLATPAQAEGWFPQPRSRASCFVRHLGRFQARQGGSCAWLNKRDTRQHAWFKLRGGVLGQGAASPQTSQSQRLSDKLQSASKEEESLYQMLVEAKQEHLFESWPEKGTAEAEKHAFFKQVGELDKSYPGGLSAYIRKARTLLGAAVRQENPFEGMTPSVPEGETLKYNTPEFIQAEEAGLGEAAYAAFVIVAGGLGERLGYGGIKLALPVETLTGKTYLEYYVTFIRALQAKAAKATGKTDVAIPLVIMTSDDTDQKTRELLALNNNFGMAPGQITIVKQDKVPALKDSEARLATLDKDPFTLDTKPHGHGDVHHLLLKNGLTKQWVEEGRRWVFFLQDTNALVVNSVLPALGISAVKNYDMNSICIPRKAGEASGAITKLTDRQGSSIIINVEYNQLDPLLRSTTYPEGDQNDPATGFSPFPGNANNLVFNLVTYHKVLQGEDQGVVTEFVNPKFKDSTRTAFTKPTRLECMMQDFPKLLVKELGSAARIGFTSFDKWLSFSPAKNSLDAGAKSVASGVPPATASSAETEFYSCHAQRMREAGADVQNGPTLTLAGIPLEGGPQVVLSPFFALTTGEMKEKVEGLTISGRSCLVVEGDGCEAVSSLKGLDLDGSLVVKAAAGASVKVGKAVVMNAGDDLVAIEGAGVERRARMTEADRIRGYVRVRKEAHVVEAGEGQQATVEGTIKGGQQ